MKIEELHHIIRNRKSVYPKQFTSREISKEILDELLESANWAPTHRLTEPWRFKVFHGEGRKKLGTFMAERYRRETVLEDFSISVYEKLKNKALQSAAVIAICMQRDARERVPEWEELAATACAVQNLWLAASVYGIGGYWSTPSDKDHLHEIVSLNQGERCLGFFYLGYYEPFDSARRRGPVSEKVEWIE
jgi:nitroreductase